MFDPILRIQNVLDTPVVIRLHSKLVFIKQWVIIKHLIVVIKGDENSRHIINCLLVDTLKNHMFSLSSTHIIYIRLYIFMTVHPNLLHNLLVPQFIKDPIT